MKFLSLRSLPFGTRSVCLALGLAGCGGDPTEEIPKPKDPPVSMKGDKLCVKMDPLPIEPGKEATRCITRHLPTMEPMDVVEIEAKQFSTHHVIFYREVNDIPDKGVHDCPPLNIFDNSFRILREPLFIGETPEASLPLPPGVAYKMPAGVAYTIEVHYFNPSPKTIEATAEICMTPAKSEKKPVPADMFFYASVLALNKNYDGKGRGLPPGKVTTLDPPGWHQLKDDVKVFGLTSHQHRIGTEFTISRSKGASDPGELLLRNTDWEHPTLLRFPDNALLTLQKDEGLRWTCTYNNTNDFYVTFGQSAFRNEMCILWGYYFPGTGFDLHFQ